MNASLGLPAEEAVALVDMWFAAGSVTATDPRTRWAHNFPDPPGKAWAWLRPSIVDTDGNTVLAASGWWTEALQGSVEVACGPAGLLVQFPSTIPNPPLEVTFPVPCWADFGRGLIPPSVASQCGAMLMDARELVRVAPALDPPLAPDVEPTVRTPLGKLRSVAEDFGLAWHFFAPHTGMIKPPSTG